MYIVLEGMVRVRKMISGREYAGHSGAGEMFGEMSLFDDSNARQMANSDGVLLRLSLDVMQQVDKQPEIVVHSSWRLPRKWPNASGLTTSGTRRTILMHPPITGVTT